MKNLKLWTEGGPRIDHEEFRDETLHKMGVYTGLWTPGETCEVSEIKLDFPWLMHANKTTTDRPAPQPSGNPTWVQELFGTWAPSGLTSATPLFVTGQRYTIGAIGDLQGYRWRAPDISGDFSYEVWVSLNGASVGQVSAPATPTHTDWIQVPRTGLLLPGMILDVFLVGSANVQPNTFTATWSQKNGNSNPGSGEAYARNNQNEIRIHNTDKDDTNQFDNLTAVEVGGSILFGGQERVITNITTNGSGAGGRHNFFVEPTAPWPGEADRQFTFQWGSSAPIPYEEEVGFVSPALANGDVQGFKGTSLPDALANLNENGYGIDLLVDYLVASEDWDFMSRSSLS